MRREYKVDSLTNVNGTIFANCYDLLYDESFKKIIGKPETERGIINAEDLLQDSSFSINEDVRKELIELFDIKTLTDMEEDLLEKLGQLDLDTDGVYNLKSMYECSNLSISEKKLVESLLNKPNRLYKVLLKKYKESFNEDLDSIGDLLAGKGSIKIPKSDGRYRSSTSTRVPSELSRLTFRRFPGGKVRINSKYYPGDIVVVNFKNPKTKENMDLSYPEYAKLPKDEQGKIDSYTIVEVNLDEPIYLLTVDDEDKPKYTAWKITLRDYYTTPQVNQEELIDEKKFREYSQPKYKGLVAIKGIDEWRGNDTQPFKQSRTPGKRTKR